jgi:SAM-dependent methyltransferase
MEGEPGVLDRVTPPAMWKRFEQMCQARADIRTLRYVLGTREKMLEWIHSVGVAADADLASCVPPLPPEELRRIVAAPTPEEFLWTGLVDLATVLGQFVRYRRSYRSDTPAILDFGCGCGRLLRFSDRGDGTWRAVGTDVNRAHVEWCRQALPGVVVRENDVHPPLPFSDRSFDCVYSVSIFTHLSDRNARAWLRDLARVLRPGGVLIVTTHGAPAVGIIQSSAVHQSMFGLSVDDAHALSHSLQSDGFVYRPYTREVLTHADAGDEYGNAFVLPRHVLERWTPEALELCEHSVGGLRGWQDIVVWRRSFD